MDNGADRQYVPVALPCGSICTDMRDGRRSSRTLPASSRNLCVGNVANTVATIGAVTGRASHRATPLAAAALNAIAGPGLMGMARVGRCAGLGCAAGGRQLVASICLPPASRAIAGSIGLSPGRKYAGKWICSCIVVSSPVLIAGSCAQSRYRRGRRPDTRRSGRRHARRRC